MRALVTGATGFVGAHLARALLDRGVAVRCLVRPAGAAKCLMGAMGVPPGVRQGSLAQRGLGW